MTAAALLTVRRAEEGKLELLRRVDLAALVAPLRDGARDSAGKGAEGTLGGERAPLVWAVDGEGTLLLAPEEREERFAAPAAADVVATLRFTLAAVRGGGGTSDGDAARGGDAFGPHPHDTPRRPGRPHRPVKHAHLM